MSRVVQEVESYSKTYDGSYENFQKFANELKILLKNKSSIGEYILKGTIEVEKKIRGLENSYKQKGRLVTSLELVHSLVRQKRRDDPQGDLTKNADLNKILNDCEAEVQKAVNAILSDASVAKEAQRLNDDTNNFYPQGKRHPGGKLSEEIPWVELIEALEHEDAFLRRENEDIWSTMEMDESGVFDSLDDVIAGKIIRTGTIPSKVLNKAIREISDIIMKKLSDEAMTSNHRPVSLH